MDSATLHAYATNAAEIARRHLSAPSGIARRAAAAFAPEARILDVGAGSGRDLALLVSEGYRAYGVEPVAQMREQAIRFDPRLEPLLLDGALPDALPTGKALADLGGPFDGVLCSAVLQHLPRAELFDAVFALRRVLRRGGRALVSIPSTRPGLDADGRDEEARLFNGVSAGELELLFQRIGFRTLSREETGDGLGREGVRWATLLFELAHGGGGSGGGADSSARPLDRIEAVLRRDRRVASYKLALLRALTDVATYQARRVVWRPDGRVGVPMDAVADLWIEYYWPLFASRTFLPQMNGEARAGEHRLGFAEELEDLRARFSGPGGLASFLSQRRSGACDAETAGRLGRLRAKLRTAIRTGPVHYAGRSTSAAAEALFDYDGASRQILVDEALWQEIALMSHWLRDSLLIRWAEFSARLADADTSSRSEPKAVMRESLRVLLQPAVPERDTRHAREIFAALPDLRCVWRGTRLRGERFHVDHVIPYTLWHNNDFWNLLPASSQANSAKRDSLPTRALLRGRRGAIVDYWHCLQAAEPRRFENDLAQLTGQPSPDCDAGFEALSETIELTALQRGCARWAG